MTNRADVDNSTFAASRTSRTSAPPHSVPSIDHPVTQWKSATRVVCFTAMSCSHVIPVGSRTSPQNLNVKLFTSTDGTCSAVRTGNDVVTDWLGGTRGRSGCDTSRGPPEGLRWKTPISGTLIRVHKQLHNKRRRWNHHDTACGLTSQHGPVWQLHDATQYQRQPADIEHQACDGHPYPYPRSARPWPSQLHKHPGDDTVERRNCRYLPDNERSRRPDDETDQVSGSSNQQSAQRACDDPGKHNREMPETYPGPDAPSDGNVQGHKTRQNNAQPNHEPVQCQDFQSHAAAIQLPSNGVAHCSTSCAPPRRANIAQIDV